MRKINLLFATLFLLLSLHAFSQENIDQKIFSDSSNIIIKGEEIRRFPSLNFIDALNGLYPWVFSASPDVNNFQFIVNGFLLTDINSINLNDIDEIVFTRNNFHGEQFPFCKAGTFFIKTKKGTSSKPEISFNTQLNSIQNKNLKLFNYTIPSSFQSVTNNINNSIGIATNNQLSFSIQKNKLNIYASGRYNYQLFPKQNEYIQLNSQYLNDTSQGNSLTKQNTYGIYVNAVYLVSKSIEIGVTGNYSHDHSNIDSNINYKNSYPSSFYDETFDIHAKNSINYYYAGVFVNWKILKGLTNKVQFEYLNQKFVSDYNDSNRSNVFGNGVEKNYTVAQIKAYTVRDILDYKILATKEINLNTGVIFNLSELKIFDSLAMLAQRYNAGSTMPSISFMSVWGNEKEKYTTLQPYFNFSYKNYFSLYGNWARILKLNTYKELSEPDKSNFYTGAEINLKNVFKINKIFNNLKLSANYGNMIENTSTNQFLSNSNELNSYSGYSSYFISTYFSPAPTIFKNSLANFKLNTSFLNHKLNIIAEWSNLKIDKMVYINVPLGFNSGYTVATKGTNSVQGLSFHVSANIIDKKKFKWLTRGSFLFPKTISDDIAKYDSLNTYRSQMNFSWQNQISYKQFFAQTNFLADVNHKYYTLNANGYNYSSANKTDFWLSNILIGYNFKMASVYVQSRNLILSQSIKDNYQPYQYFGIGANFKL